MTGCIKPFSENESIWDNVKSALLRRILWQRKTKYFSILKSIPEHYSISCGYHSNCLKNFTAVPNTIGKIDKPESSQSATRTRSQLGSTSTASSSGVLQAICIFCDKSRKKNEKLGQNECRDTEIRIREAANQLNDVALFSKFGEYLFGEGPDFVALEVKYHHSCKRTYLNKVRSISTPSKGHNIRETAFKSLMKYIQSSVIDNDQPEMVNSLLERYKNIYRDNGGDTCDLEHYSIQSCVGVYIIPLMNMY